MDAEVMRARVGDARVAHLATLTPDARPHVVACCFALDGDRIFTAVDAKPKSTFALQRLANIAAHPDVSVLVDHYDEDWTQLWWVRVDGIARIVDDEADRAHALAELQEKYAQYRDTPPPGPVITIDIASWRSWP